MAINNVQMDIGTFFGQFLGNILGKIQSVTAPLEPVLQVLNERLPVISDLLNKIGQPSVTLLTLAQTLGGVDTAPIQGAGDDRQLGEQRSHRCLGLGDQFRQF